MREVPAKTIVTRTKCPQAWFGCDYNMNLYKGCCHGCIYCDSRSECYGVEEFDEVRVKKDALAIVEKELRAKRKTGVVGTGAMSDPYNPFEAQMKLTRGALELFDRYGFGVCLYTKGDLVVRDADLLARIAKHSPVCVCVTVTTADDTLRAKIEPHAPSSAQRFSAIEALSQRGIFAGVLLMPLLPFVNDTGENVTAIVGRTADAGARFVYPMFGVTLRQNQRTYFYERLDEQFPGVRKRYESAFGDAYSCGSQNMRALAEEFRQCCQKRGLLYRMPDIIEGYRHSYGQMTMF